ncbi:MAG: hypothetical protein MUC78_09225 [Bacteroidales bacterium]|nr:hypothetical protein [Bacteroidales bacterium]
MTRIVLVGIDTHPSGMVLVDILVPAIACGAIDTHPSGMEMSACKNYDKV